MDLSKVIEILEGIIHFPSKRRDLINQFQLSVWDNQLELDDECQVTLLQGLAYDLDFYESDPKTRAEDSSYYDDIRLHEEIVQALDKLNKKAK